MERIAAWVRDVLGLGLVADELDAGRMAARAVVVYVVVLVFVRVGGKRFLGRGAAFDLVFAIALGGCASSAIVGRAPFGPGLAACAALVLAHRAVASLAARSTAFHQLAHGRSVTLVDDGRPDARAMRRHRVTTADLELACRQNGLGGLGEAGRIVLEANGRMSVLAVRPVAQQRTPGDHREEDPGR